MSSLASDPAESRLVSDDLLIPACTTYQLMKVTETPAYLRCPFIYSGQQRRAGRGGAGGGMLPRETDVGVSACWMQQGRAAHACEHACMFMRILVQVIVSTSPPVSVSTLSSASTTRRSTSTRISSPPSSSSTHGCRTPCHGMPPRHS